MRQHTRLPRIALGAFLILTITWIASRSMLPPTNYDSGLYHFNAIRWINTCPIVPGLGNLHGRLAFNQSFFTYVASLNPFPFAGHGRSLANCFLLLLTIATFAWLLLPAFRQPRLLFTASPLRYASVLFTFPILGYLLLSSNGLASPSPDLAATLLQLVMLVLIAHFVAEWNEDGDPLIHRSAVLVTLAATALTIKLSNLAFAAGVIAVVFLRLWKSPSAAFRLTLRIVAFACAIILLSMLRGVVLSGAPLYPSTIGHVPVEWAVPTDRIREEAHWVYSWARQPDVHWSKVLGTWEWLGPWSKRLAGDFVGVVYPVALATVLSGSCVCLAFRVRHSWPATLILTPVMVGLVYWFVTAPEPRLAHALLLCLPVGLSLMFLDTVRRLLHFRSLAIVTCCLLILCNVHFIHHAIAHRRTLRSISLSGWHSVPKVPLIQKTTVSGLVVHVPEQGWQTWDAPLPSTPYLDDRLRLRVPGELGSGFVVPQR